MVNLSLSNAHVPDKWKTAIVKPLLKKSGLDVTHKNFYSGKCVKLTGSIECIGYFQMNCSVVYSHK